MLSKKQIDEIAKKTPHKDIINTKELLFDIAAKRHPWLTNLRTVYRILFILTVVVFTVGLVLFFRDVSYWSTVILSSSGLAVVNLVIGYVIKKTVYG